MVTIKETLDAWVRQGLIDSWSYARSMDGTRPGIIIYAKIDKEVSCHVR